MNEKKLFYALSDIDDDLIEGASRPPKRNPLLIYLPTAAAACLCIVIGLFAFLRTPETGANRIATRSGVGLPSSTEAHAVSGDPSEDGAFPGISIAPTGAPVASPAQHFSQSEIPADFSFQLNWKGKRFSSENHLYIHFGSGSHSLILTPEELRAVWNLIGEAVSGEYSQGNTFILNYTIGGEKYHMEFPADCVPMQELGKLLDKAASRRP